MYFFSRYQQVPYSPTATWSYNVQEQVAAQSSHSYFPTLGGMTLRELSQKDQKTKDFISRQLSKFDKTKKQVNEQISSQKNEISRPTVKEKNKILQQLTTLQSDVKGFSTGLEGIAETVIVGKSKGLGWEEKLSDATKTNERKEILQDWINDTEKTEQHLAHQIEKTNKRRSTFEDAMVGFFTDYVCADDC